VVPRIVFRAFISEFLLQRKPADTLTEYRSKNEALKAKQAYRVPNMIYLTIHNS
jgi:hypothetical protein